MALLETCSEANRIIDQELSTEWTRTLVTSLDNAVEGFYSNVNYSFANTQSPVKIFVADRPYWRYDIKRTMAYHYFGLTKPIAVDFANRVHMKLNRVAFPLGFNYDSSTTSGYWEAVFSAASGGVADAKPAYGRPISRGTAVASPDHDDAWQVEVNISESWTIPWREPGTATGKYMDSCWDLFEQEPNQYDETCNLGGGRYEAGSFFLGFYDNGNSYPHYVYDSCTIETEY